MSTTPAADVALSQPTKCSLRYFFAWEWRAILLRPNIWLPLAIAARRLTKALLNSALVRPHTPPLFGTTEEPARSEHSPTGHLLTATEASVKGTTEIAEGKLRCHADQQKHTNDPFTDFIELNTFSRRYPQEPSTPSGKQVTHAYYRPAARRQQRQAMIYQMIANTQRMRDSLPVLFERHR